MKSPGIHKGHGWERKRLNSNTVFPILEKKYISEVRLDKIRKESVGGGWRDATEEVGKSIES